MSRLDPPGVLLERSFLDALLDEDHPQHDIAQRCYAELLDDYQAQRLLLKVLHDDRRAIADDPDRAGRGREALAPATSVRIAAQHRRAAARMDGDADIALLLVVLDRYRLSTVATFDARLRGYEVNVVPATTS